MKNLLVLGPLRVRLSRKGLASWGYARIEIGGLRLFSRTNSARTYNLAAFHSSHSLTWRWVLSISRQPFCLPKPYAGRNSMGFGAGFGQLLGFHTYRTNGGPQWSVSLLWLSFDFHQQKPMWYRDMFSRREEDLERLERENRQLRQELDTIRHGAARVENANALQRMN